MANYTTEEICSMFYKEVKDEYPDMTFTQCKDIVKAQWRMLKKEMQSEEYRPVRLHYFGIFKATVPNSKICLKYANISKSKELITEKEMIRIENKIKNILKYYGEEKQD